MEVRRSIARTLAFAGMLFALSGQPGSAQTAARVVVPAPPGGAGDIFTRLVTEQVGRAESRTFVIENRAGAGTIIGTEAVARAVPDGTTLLMTAPYLLIAPHLRKLSFDPLTSFEPVCHLVSSPGVIAVNGDSPHRTLGDFLNAARAKPGELTFAAAGPGTVHHIGFEMLKRAANVNMIFVPYTGGAPAITALLGGHVTAVFAEYAPLAEHLKSGRLRALATTAQTRPASLPDVPAVVESFKDYEVDFWWGLFAPAGTPKATVSQLAGAFTAAMKAPEIRTKLDAQGFLPVGSCGADFAALLRNQYEHYGRVVREANIKAE